MHWSLKQSKIQYQHQKMQDKDYSDEHEHCTMQPFWHCNCIWGPQRG